MEEKTFTRSEVRDIVDKMARTLALLYYFMGNEVIEEFGAQGKEVVRRAVHKYGEARGKKIQEQVLAEGLPLTVENLTKFYDLPLPLAWVSEKIREEENFIEKKVTYCPFAEEWKELGAQELGLIYCEQDLCMRRGYNPEFDLEMFTNVMEGSPFCHTIVQWKKAEENGG
ncbi:MAG: L-2-amino-thiazoline-4-carboxylic acid hydrolase [Bacillota bacterium]